MHPKVTKLLAHCGVQLWPTEGLRDTIFRHDIPGCEIITFDIKRDVIAIPRTPGVTSAADVLSRCTQVGEDVVIILSAISKLIVLDANLSDLAEHPDLHFDIAAYDVDDVIVNITK